MLMKEGYARSGPCYISTIEGLDGCHTHGYHTHGLSRLACPWSTQLPACGSEICIFLFAHPKMRHNRAVCYHTVAKCGVVDASARVHSDVCICSRLQFCATSLPSLASPWRSRSPRRPLICQGPALRRPVLLLRQRGRHHLAWL